MNLPKLLAGAALAIFAASCEDNPTKASTDPAPDHSHDGAHGGIVHDLSGGVGHVEFVHDDAQGIGTIYITGPDAKSPLPIEKAPQIKLTTESGQVVIDTEPQGATDGKAHEFRAQHDALKQHDLAGRFSLEIGGSTYTPDIQHDH